MLINLIVDLNANVINAWLLISPFSIVKRLSIHWIILHLNIHSTLHLPLVVHFGIVNILFISAIKL